MTPRFARQLLAAALVALHATVMVCGPCFHELPGWGHVGEHSLCADRSDVRGPIESSLVRADDCPICSLLSQAQLALDPARVSSVRHIGLVRPERPSDKFTPTRLHSTSPRAPPARAVDFA